MFMCPVLSPRPITPSHNLIPQPPPQDRCEQSSDSLHGDHTPTSAQIAFVDQPDSQIIFTNRYPPFTLKCSINLAVFVRGMSSFLTFILSVIKIVMYNVSMIKIHCLGKFKQKFVHRGQDMLARRLFWPF